MNPLLRYVRERMQNLSKMRAIFEMVENNQSRLFSSTPWGKNAATPRSPRTSGPSSRNMEEASESSIAAARLLLCSVCSTFVRRLSHSLLSQSVPHLL